MRHSPLPIKMASAGLVILALGLVPALAQPAEKPGTITVSGRAEIVLEPDRAAIEVGVVTVDPSAKKAMAENRTGAAALIEAAKAAGIAAADIQTVQFQVNPRYAQFDRSTPDNRPEIVGYEVVNQISVLIRAVEDAGTVLDALLSTGANRAGAIRFIVSDLDRKLDSARTEAVKDAARKARLYAEAAGVALGPVLGIDEAGIAPPQPVPYARGAAMEMAAVPIEAGSQTATASVTVTFAIAE